ncbi:MAG: polysaccharide deacetylase family protein [Lachnospiraceae bacterium]|nr:polysaccharide deacetylase family protein [Lachnospiraceae bacterium]
MKRNREWISQGFVLTIIFLALTAAALYVPAAIYVSATAQERELPIYSVQREDKKIALSFDCAWGNGDTQAILDVLAEQQVRASFFITGSWLEAYPDTVKAIVSAGHDLGNHSQTHPHMTGLSKEKMKEEIMTVHEGVKELTGQDMKLFRPPYGDYNNEVIKTARACGYYSVQWDVDSQDWKDYGVESIIEMVTENKDLGNGSIILMHNGAKYTKDALGTVILTLKESGYELVPVSELIYYDSYQLDHTGRQIPDSVSN